MKKISSDRSDFPSNAIRAFGAAINANNQAAATAAYYGRRADMPRDRTSPASRRVRLDMVWFEGTSALLLALLTLVKRDWIEAVFQVDPDFGSASLEVAIAAGCILVALALSLLACRTHTTLARDVS